MNSAFRLRHMSPNTRPRPSGDDETPLPLPHWALAGFTVKTIAVLLIAFFTYRTLRTREEAAERIAQSLSAMDSLGAVAAQLADAETGQRGYLLTGDEVYLVPFQTARAAIDATVGALRPQFDSPAQQVQVAELLELAESKLRELDETVQLRRNGDLEGALAIVRTNEGKAVMDRLRELLADLRRSVLNELDARQAAFAEAVSVSTQVAFGGAAIILALIGVTAVANARDYRAGQRETWLRAGLAAFRGRIQGEQRLDVLGDHVLQFFSEFLNARAGVVFRGSEGALHRVSTFAAPQATALVREGETLAGECARQNRLMLITDVPAGYLPVSSGLGEVDPRQLLVAPAAADGEVLGVVELAFLHHLASHEVELCSRVLESLGVAFRGASDRSRLEELLEETQRQAEELQTQQEELRVINEELEEQTEALKRSQAQLEAQQAELEQINSHLEEQTELLVAQKDELARSQQHLTEKADELERANQYKSEFLANMSHELRTPLNSSLILAKLLADNKAGNLTEEQVRFAQTIMSAGNDLLALINDILDLSRIEAGRVEVVVEPVTVARQIESLARTFEPMAREKGLAFHTFIADDAPPVLHTDQQRFTQILRNLLSNALKFTDHGEVRLHVGSAGPGRVAFVVRDSGIGIPPHQQDLIFEAFRQADGSTHRKYGGTGLGLSISRDLARLLGGTLHVTSAPGEGSAFTLTLPVGGPMAAAPPEEQEPRRLTAPLAPAIASGNAPRVTDATASRRRSRTAPPLVAPAAPVDASAAARNGSRLLLVVEDDRRFAAILADLAKELGFECEVAETATAGLTIAASRLPSAIVLDVNLPDHSGLGVLDQLKHDSRTRHIPVHVVSVADYAHEAMQRGAIGYALKPVKRDELVSALKQLEAKFSQHVRRVLVVEDDARQRESLRQLLSTDGVELIAVPNAAEALEQLGHTSFDCMVMDLNLPDLSGYELLDRMAQQEDVSFPPVIVYTGRSLSRDEEQRLQRYSRSIIIKGARSPERLLDEVTLFLHQVESSLPPDRQRMLQSVRNREAAFEGRRILVVEDDARNIFALSSVLEPRGATVEVARNGRQALEVLAKWGVEPGRGIDLVLMDVMMPEMDGLTATREIRANPEWRRVPIVALTAKAMKDDQERCLDAGANDYIAKPLDVDRLLSLLRVWLPR
ncbi:MAG: response regulator [Vicinamibacterales bacterium]